MRNEEGRERIEEKRERERREVGEDRKAGREGSWEQTHRPNKDASKRHVVLNFLWSGLLLKICRKL